jgi:hypothetical protein
MNIGSIVDGEYLFVNTSGELELTITQDSTDREIIVDGMFALSGAFTELKVANASTEDYEITILVLGSRTANNSTPGIYSH